MKLSDLTESHDIPDDLVQDILAWQEYADYDHVWTNQRHGWQQRLIAFMQNRKPELFGQLYRGSVCQDDVALALSRGPQATHEPGQSLLESWAKTPGQAGSYLHAIAGTGDQSGVLMKFAASDLDVIFDVDVLGEEAYEPGEVLVRVAPRRLTPKNVVALVFNDYDGSGNTTFFAGNRSLTYGEFEKFLRSLPD